ncbi:MULTISPECIES: copper chaperone [Dyadobacter]|uniref:Copper chaperone n=2 Tax=Dyadobacter TaxID=120831 RepID=A0A5R9KZ59_9BACT|nr:MULTISPECIES: copper chaperone [Dyadobacter]QRR01601.1 copper chaperone [Dyadobacter sandarakinus]TLV01380.1 copper chaperone [Dyadobacter luticola]
METLNFKTSIKDKEGVTVVTPFLNNLKHVDGWNIDLSDSDKLLTVQTTDNRIGENVIEAVIQAGFSAEAVGRP